MSEKQFQILNKVLTRLIIVLPFCCAALVLCDLMAEYVFLSTSIVPLSERIWGRCVAFGAVILLCVLGKLVLSLHGKYKG